jgi:hypothetical protein
LLTMTSSVAPSELRARLAQARSNIRVFNIGGAIAARASSQRPTMARTRSPPHRYTAGLPPPVRRTLSPAGPAALKTNCHHRRQGIAFDLSGSRKRLAAADVSPALASGGTPKPGFTRATISLGSGHDGAPTSATFPVPGVIWPMQINIWPPNISVGNR